MNSKYKYITHKIILITVLILSSIQAKEQKIFEADSTEKIKFYYAEYHEEIPRFKIHINFDGKVKIYKENLEGVYKLIKTIRYSQQQIDSLSYILDTLNFASYPKYLPETNRMMWPMLYVRIGYRITEIDSMKFVRAYLLPDEKIYPKGFFKIVDVFKQIISNHL